MITFIHTADVHYGMENYGRIDPKTGIHSRLLDFDKAFNFCVDTAIEQNIDLFVFAGDAYKTTNPSPTQQRLFLNALLRLHKAGIPIVIVVGNHDNPLAFGKANTLDIFSDLPLTGFHVIAKPASLVIQTKSGPVQIVGIPWPTKNTLALHEAHALKSTNDLTAYISQKVGTIIQHLAQQLDPQLPAILTGHLTVASGIFSGSEKKAVYGQDPILMTSELAIPPFDYVALGHLHRFQNLNPQGFPPVVYSGSIERIDFGERKEEKGFCLVTLKQKGSTHIEFIKTPQRPFVQVEVFLEDNDEVSQTSQIITALQDHVLTDSIVKIMYHLKAQQQDRVDLAAINRACQKAHHVIGIFPIHEPHKRTYRSALKIDMDFEEILTMYFQDNKELEKKHIDSLLEKARLLKYEITNTNENDSL